MRPRVDCRHSANRHEYEIFCTWQVWATEWTEDSIYKIIDLLDASFESVSFFTNFNIRYLQMIITLVSGIHNQNGM